MAINFEAANMAGYNNPKIEVFKVALDATGTKVNEAPSFATISNTLKSGFLPVLYATLATTGNSVAVPFTAINSEGNYLFSCVFQVSTTPAPVMISIMYLKNAGQISANIVNL